MEITLPNRWQPRHYQQRLWRYLESGGKRAVAVWHRRAGKDEVCLHWAACAAMQRVGNYWHMLPEASQARKAIWDAINPHTGKRRIDEAFPPSIRVGQRDDDMRIKLINGSSWQIVGSDNFNSLVGSPPTGLVFSEYSLTNPAAWDYLRPILAENGGWCIFMMTPRGRNHAWKLYELARSRPDWFAELLTVEETKAIGPDIIADERASGMSEDMMAQEYYCSFDAALPGAYYGKLLQNADTEKRIGRAPWAPDATVHTACRSGGRTVLRRSRIGRGAAAAAAWRSSAGPVGPWRSATRNRLPSFRRCWHEQRWRQYEDAEGDAKQCALGGADSALEDQLPAAERSLQIRRSPDQSLSRPDGRADVAGDGAGMEYDRQQGAGGVSTQQSF